MGDHPSTSRDAWAIRRYESVDSTQRVAADLVANGTPHRTVVVAERQTAGYGRKGDVWHDAPGASLLLTIIVRPHDPGAVSRYPMIAALACIDAIRTVTGLDALLKWPNDVLLNGRKVAGILGDATWQGARLEALRLGIGINITGSRAAFDAHDLPDATSVAAETAGSVDRDAVLTALLASFARNEDLVVAARDAEVLAAWRASLSTLGRHILATRMDGTVVTGIAARVTDDGDLIVTSGTGGDTRLRATDVRSLRHIA